MIQITEQPEPSHFDKKVRQPGLVFLRECPKPRPKDWSKHDYWRKISDDLYERYKGICAYTGMMFITRRGKSANNNSDNAHRSVDHFRPKSRCPLLAYEWNNYRLTTQKTNRHKADDDNIIDPFLVQPEWFNLDIPTCLIKAGTNVSDEERSQIEYTINVLKLNDDDEYVANRHDILCLYINQEIPLEDLTAKYPFIASELQRQNLTDIATLNTRFKTLPQATSL
ncbi:MAG: hypothetical protein LBQ66_00480 [Planctomycetaceae bacterium]|nr:hypothetical protein [Planctomycetaceae bacterium]